MRHQAIAGTSPDASKPKRDVRSLPALAKDARALRDLMRDWNAFVRENVDRLLKN